MKLSLITGYNHYLESPQLHSPSVSSKNNPPNIHAANLDAKQLAQWEKPLHILNLSMFPGILSFLIFFC